MQNTQEYDGAAGDHFGPGVLSRDFWRRLVRCWVVREDNMSVQREQVGSPFGAMPAMVVSVW